MKFEQKFIQIPTAATWWPNEDIGKYQPATFRDANFDNIILSQGFQNVSFWGFDDGHPKWLFAVQGSPEWHPFFTDNGIGSLYGIFASYTKIGVREQQFTDGIGFERAGQNGFFIVLENEDSLFPGFLNVWVNNPIPTPMAPFPIT